MDLKVFTFSNGVSVVNTTPHALTFLDGAHVVTVETSGLLVSARVSEQETKSNGGVTFVTPTFQPSPEGDANIATINQLAPGALVVGSVVAAQAYPGRVVGMLPAPGFERVAPEAKRMSVSRFQRY